MVGFSPTSPIKKIAVEFHHQQGDKMTFKIGTASKSIGGSPKNKIKSYLTFGGRYQ